MATSLGTMTEDQLKSMYKEYIDEFDPSPIHYGDDYGTPQDYDSWRSDYLYDLDNENDSN